MFPDHKTSLLITLTSKEHFCVFNFFAICVLNINQLNSLFYITNFNNCFTLQPCTEVFFLTLFHDFRNLLTPLLVEMTKNVQNNGTRDFMDVLKKDAS